MVLESSRTVAQCSRNKLVVLVTGANKGIGFEVARQLASEGVITILTSRDKQRGTLAVRALQNLGLEPRFHQLDVTDSESIQRLVKWIAEDFGGLDILINNAAVLGKIVHGNSVESAKALINTNFHGAVNLTRALLPLMRPSSQGSRIIMISSAAGKLEWLPCAKWRTLLLDEKKLSNTLIQEFLDEFLCDLKSGKLENWPDIPFRTRISDYSVSKMALNAYTRLLARDTPNIYINCMCPGMTRTDMTLDVGDHGPDVGAKTAVFLALTTKPVSGLFFRSARVISYEFLQETEVDYIEAVVKH